MAFNSPGINKVLRYVKKKYGTEPEFLWARFPNNAILRHKNSSKWYAAVLIVPKQKLGIAGEGSIDILDLKCDPVLIGSLIDRKSIFPGYHMNKEHWITVLLDGSIRDKEVFGLIDLSYDITEGK